ncbi:MAG: hypothetical protein RLW61_20195 [Gammaproteobacteria bacterium]|jgi:hypothetical protein
MKKLTLSIAALGAALVAPHVVAGDDAEYVTIRSTDFRGRPPFTRNVERLPAAEVARLEAERRAPVVESDEVVTITTVDYSGRPPFTRRVETLPVSEVARLELEPAPASEPRDITRRNYSRVPARHH